MGEYIISVRKKDINWYIGGMTNWDERDVELDFSFLPSKVRYTATLFTDGINANKQAEDYRTEKLIIDKNSRIKLHLASGGGFAMKLELYPVRGEVTSIPVAESMWYHESDAIKTSGCKSAYGEKRLPCDGYR